MSDILGPKVQRLEKVAINNVTDGKTNIKASGTEPSEQLLYVVMGKNNDVVAIGHLDWNKEGTKLFFKMEEFGTPEYKDGKLVSVQNALSVKNIQDIALAKAEHDVKSLPGTDLERLRADILIQNHIEANLKDSSYKNGAFNFEILVDNHDQDKNGRIKKNGIHKKDLSKLRLDNSAVLGVMYDLSLGFPVDGDMLKTILPNRPNGMPPDQRNDADAKEITSKRIIITKRIADLMELLRDTDDGLGMISPYKNDPATFIFPQRDTTINPAAFVANVDVLAEKFKGESVKTVPESLTALPYRQGKSTSKNMA